MYKKEDIKNATSLLFIAKFRPSAFHMIRQKKVVSFCGPKRAMFKDATPF